MAKKKASRKKKTRRNPAKAATQKYVQVKTRRFKIADLEAAPYNPRVITDVALQGLLASLETFGLLAPPVVNVAGGAKRLVGGHQRIRALQDAEETHVDCVVVEFDESTERRANLTLNNAAIEGTFVPELTQSVIARIADLVGEEGTALLGKLRFDTLIRQVLKDIKSRPGIDDEVRHGLSEDDYVPTLLRSSANSKHGVVYELGEHRLLCGRITSVGTLDALGEERADMAFTRLVSKEPFRESFLDAHLGHLLENTTGGIHVATNTARLAQVHATFLALGGYWSNTLVCYSPTVKPLARETYRDVTVPILYGWRAKGMRAFYGDRTQSNAWRLKAAPPRDDVPVEAVVRHVLNSTQKGGTILDVLVSRGATLIAAEKTGRRLIGYVPSPREMDLVRKRWTRIVHGPEGNWKAATTAAT